MAERVGFEPTVPCGTPHFECQAGRVSQCCQIRFRPPVWVYRELGPICRSSQWWPVLDSALAEMLAASGDRIPGGASLRTLLAARLTPGTGRRHDPVAVGSV